MDYKSKDAYGKEMKKMESSKMDKKHKLAMMKAAAKASKKDKDAMMKSYK